ncbi:hypothetical protein F5887DRAFT_919113 [Amanita rubescens]|nr:hypothetical protein F5887DRAFT_919113 [Amanita rubescens]
MVDSTKRRTKAVHRSQTTEVGRTIATTKVRGRNLPKGKAHGRDTAVIRMAERAHGLTSRDPEMEENRRRSAQERMTVVCYVVKIYHVLQIDLINRILLVVLQSWPSVIAARLGRCAKQSHCHHRHAIIFQYFGNRGLRSRKDRQAGPSTIDFVNTPNMDESPQLTVSLTRPTIGLPRTKSRCPSRTVFNVRYGTRVVRAMFSILRLCQRQGEVDRDYERG